MRRGAFATLVAGILWTHIASVCRAGEQVAGANGESGDRVAKALDDMEQAGRSLAEWRKAVEAGAELSEKDFRNLQASAQELYREVGAIMERRQQKRRAERQAEGRIQSVPEQQARTKVWVDQMRALGAGAEQKRSQALEEIRTALKSDDKGAQYAALSALQQVGDVNYDKAALRPLIVPFVEHAKGHTFAAAAYALHHTGQQPGDLELVQQAWERRTPALEGWMSRLLLLFGDGKFEGRSEEIMLDLLGSPEADVRREALRGMWGAAVSDNLANRVIELADDPESRHDAIYFGLSTFKTKNEAVVDKLIESLADPDWINNGGRALWGLGFGVPEPLQPKVAAAAAELYAARSDPQVREEARNIVRNYAGAAAADALPE